MQRHCLLVVALIFMSATAVFALHGEHNDTPVIIPPAHEPPLVLTPPVVEVPPPVVPPVSSPVVLPPVLGSTSTILPTDVSGFGAKIPALKPNEQSPLNDPATLLSKDPRCEFTRDWIPVDSNLTAAGPPGEPNRLVSFTEEDNKIHGAIEHIETSERQPAFMPTVGATYQRLNAQHLKLVDGAVIVRGVDEHVFVSTGLCDEDVTVKIGGKALALISAFDGKPTVLNLTDASSNAVFLYVPVGEGQVNSLKVKPGRIAEAYKLDMKPTSNLVAKRIEINQHIGPHCGLLVCQCHYVRELHKFNLVGALPNEEYHRGGQRDFRCHRHCDRIFVSRFGRVCEEKQYRSFGSWRYRPCKHLGSAA